MRDKAALEEDMVVKRWEMLFGSGDDEDNEDNKCVVSGLGRLGADFWNGFVSEEEDGDWTLRENDCWYDGDTREGGYY